MSEENNSQENEAKQEQQDEKLTEHQQERLNEIRKHLNQDVVKELVERGNHAFIHAKSRLLRDRFFYYNIIKRFRPQMMMDFPTVGVSWQKDRMHILYNPIFASHYTPEEYAVIFEHEVSHFVFAHMENFQDTKEETFRDAEDYKNHVREKAKQKIIHQMKNIAMDRAINVYLKRLPNIRQFRYEVEGIAESKEAKQQTQNGTDGNKSADDNIVAVHQKGAIPELDIVEVRGITEESFKEVLKKGGYEGDVEQIDKYNNWKYYFDLLMQCPKKQEAIEAAGKMDVHMEGSAGQEQEGKGEKLSVPGQSENKGEQGDDRFEDGEGKENPDQEDIDDIIADAYKETENKSDIPGHLQQKVEQTLIRQQSKPLPWNVLLKKFINRAKKTVREANPNVRNIYYNQTQAILTAYKNKPLYKVGVIYDTSGSCSDPNIQGKFWDEVEGLRKEGAEITVYYTDAQVEHVQKINPKKRISPDDYEGVGGGGTDLDKGIVKSIDDKNNIHIMLSDCIMHFKLGPDDLRGQKVICACNTDNKMPEHYGRTIRVNEDEL